MSLTDGNSWVTAGGRLQGTQSAAAFHLRPVADGPRSGPAEVPVPGEVFEQMGQPYAGLQDLWLRGRPSLPLVQRLIRIGALDALSPGLVRRMLLLQATELHWQSRNRTATDGQLPLGGEPMTAGPRGLPEMPSRDRLGAGADPVR